MTLEIKPKKTAKAAKIPKVKILKSAVPLKIKKPPKVKIAKVPEETEISKTVALMEKKPKKPKNYLNNKDMLLELKKSKKDGKMTTELTKMIMLLTRRYAEHPWFVNYTYNNDMQSFALLTVVKFWDRFDLEKGSNAFAYFTQIIKRAFQQYKLQEKKHRTIRDLLLVEHGETPSYTFMSEYDDDNYHFDKLDNFENEEFKNNEPGPVIDIEIIKEIDNAAVEVVEGSTDAVSELIEKEIEEIV
jgi:DNA-directed RNA polymerase specialized sigma subunit